MLIPDNIHPEETIYYNGAIVLKTIRESKALDMFDLYVMTKSERELSMPVFVLCLDWLYLLNLVGLNNNGEVELCSLNLS